MLKRHYKDLLGLFNRRQVLIIYGARRTGKTTLLKTFLKNSQLKTRYDTGDSLTIRKLFSEVDLNEIIDYASGYDIIAIDEAQEIPDISRGVKLIADHTDTKVILTGSSSFKLAQDIGEPLTGRKRTIKLFPFSQSELIKTHNPHDLKENLRQYLVYGTYPEVVTSSNNKEKSIILKELVDSYLLKDILSHDRIKSPKVLVQLLKLLAFQIGSEVSLNELARKTSVDVKTIARYLDLLEKCFVIFKLPPFSSNLRKSISAKSKYFFVDNGIRNALISQFAPVDERIDTGALFENFIIVERMKKLTYDDFYGNLYFWRDYNGREINFIEEIDGKLNVAEIKFSSKKQPKLPAPWLEKYGDSNFIVVNSKNYLKFVL